MPKKLQMSEELTKVITASKITAASTEIATQKKGRSNAWKGLEYAIAEALRKAGFKKAKRVMKNDQIMAASQHLELPDVNVPEAPFLQIDGKYSQKTWNAVERLFLECQAKYQIKPEDRFIMVTQRASSHTKLAHITLDYFAELAAKAYLKGKSSDQWVCPQCRGEQLTTQPAGMGQELHRCGVCCLEFITKQNTRPSSDKKPDAPRNS